jgi:hypothetical protein
MLRQKLVIQKTRGGAVARRKNPRTTKVAERERSESLIVWQGISMPPANPRKQALSNEFMCKISCVIVN